MRKLVSAVAVLAMAGPAQSADRVVRQMTPAAIEDAISHGTESCYPVRENGKLFACFSTPYSRVVAKAKLAAMSQRSMDTLPPDVLAPELSVLVVHRGNRVLKISVANRTGVEAKPLRTDANQLSAQAWFPLSALREGSTVRVDFEGPFCGDKSSCSSPLVLDGVR